MKRQPLDLIAFLDELGDRHAAHALTIVALVALVAAFLGLG